MTAAAIGVGGSVIVALAAFWASVKNTNKTSALTFRVVELTEQGQMTDRYTKAVGQLGDELRPGQGLTVASTGLIDRVTAVVSVANTSVSPETPGASLRGQGSTAREDSSVVMGPAAEMADALPAYFFRTRRLCRSNRCGGVGRWVPFWGVCC